MEQKSGELLYLKEYPWDNFGNVSHGFCFFLDEYIETRYCMFVIEPGV